MAKKSSQPTKAALQARADAINLVREGVVAIDTALADERRANNTFPVIGEGSHFAKIMFVGEAPGKKESLTGRPFCGASGKFLDKLLDSVQLKREDIYITNIVNDRPTDNRDPKPDEIAAYGVFLDRQIDIIQPQVIATLGRFSMVYVMERFGLHNQIEPISQMHGRSFTAKTRYGSVQIVPLYHPAVALYNGSMQSTLLADFKVMKKIIS
ncbi:MAG: hypothetical protein RL094_531 [Candidatus Parcubacteria bacterium]|jgi:DNA polymerase